MSADTLPILSEPKPAAAKFSAKELVERLHRHYIKPGAFPGGAFVHEVGLNGPARQSRCDAIHIGFTSTSGRILTGHEIKVSRSDWLHELDQPDKASRWADNCHAWYVVAPSVDVVHPEELPHGWGLMVPNLRTATRMDIKVKATVHDERVPSWLIVRSILARWDTLREQAIHKVRIDAQEDMQRGIDEARQEFAAKAVAVSDGTVERVAAIIRRVRAESGDQFIKVDDDNVVAALVDLTRARAAAQELRWEIDRAVRNVREVTDPFANAYGELKRVLDALDGARREAS